MRKLDKKAQSLAANKLMIIVLIILVVAIVALWITRADILHYLKFIPDYSIPENDSEVDLTNADHFGIPTTCPYLIAFLENNKFKFCKNYDLKSECEESFSSYLYLDAENLNEGVIRSEEGGWERNVWGGSIGSLLNRRFFLDSEFKEKISKEKERKEDFSYILNLDGAYFFGSGYICKSTFPIQFKGESDYDLAKSLNAYSGGLFRVKDENDKIIVDLLNKACLEPRTNFIQLIFVRSLGRNRHLEFAWDATKNQPIFRERGVDRIITRDLIGSSEVLKNLLENDLDEDEREKVKDILNSRSFNEFVYKIVITIQEKTPTRIYLDGEEKTRISLKDKKYQTNDLMDRIVFTNTEGTNDVFYFRWNSEKNIPEIYVKRMQRGTFAYLGSIITPHKTVVSNEGWFNKKELQEKVPQIYGTAFIPDEFRNKIFSLLDSLSWEILVFNIENFCRFENANFEKIFDSSKGGEHKAAQALIRDKILKERGDYTKNWLSENPECKEGLKYSCNFKDKEGECLFDRNRFSFCFKEFPEICLTNEDWKPLYSFYFQTGNKFYERRIVGFDKPLIGGETNERPNET
jgi:hypothetical protein